MGSRITILLLLAIVATACNPCKRAMRRGCYKSDTVTVRLRDTVTTQTLRVDTVIDARVDSVTVVNDRLRIEYRKVHDSIYLYGECLGDTIYLDREIKVPTLQPTPPETAVEKGRRYALNALAAVGGLFVLWLLLFGKPKQRKA